MLVDNIHNPMSQICMTTSEYQYHEQNGHEMSRQRHQCQNAKGKQDHFRFQLGPLDIQGETTTPSVPRGKVPEGKYQTHVFLHRKLVAKPILTAKQVEDLFRLEDQSQVVQKYLPKTPSKPISPKHTSLKTVSRSIPSPAGQPAGQPAKFRSSRSGYVINPKTGREIKIGGTTYRELCLSGNYHC